MKLNTTTKTILAAILLIVFWALLVAYVNPMIENRYSLGQTKTP